MNHLLDQIDRFRNEQQQFDYPAERGTRTIGTTGHASGTNARLGYPPMFVGWLPSKFTRKPNQLLYKGVREWQSPFPHPRVKSKQIKRFKKAGDWNVLAVAGLTRPTVRRGIPGPRAKAKSISDIMS